MITKAGTKFIAEVLFPPKESRKTSQRRCTELAPGRSVVSCQEDNQGKPFQQGRSSLKGTRVIKWNVLLNGKVFNVAGV